MKASFVDLRNKSSQILRALQRKERVMVYYRGRPKAVMQPVDDAEGVERLRARDREAFGLWADRDDLKNVPAYVRALREGRPRDQ